MSGSSLVAHSGAAKMTFDDLKLLPVPEPTRTHQPIPHHRIVEALIETLGFRHISVVGQEYAATPDGARMFAVLDLDYEFSGCRFSIGIRNANDKSMRLAMTVGYRVFVCDNMAFKGDFTPVLAKHSNSFDLIDAISIGVDKAQRNFEPLQKTVSDWKANQLSGSQAKLIIYEAFVEGKLQVTPRLLKTVHHHYFEPEYDEFKATTLWSLSNAFTSSFKQLKPFEQYKAAAKLSPFLQRYSQPFQEGL
jgi:hypothetical protein